MLRGMDGRGAGGGALVHDRGWAASASTPEELPEPAFHQAADHTLDALQDTVEVGPPYTRAAPMRLTRACTQSHGLERDERLGRVWG